MRGILTVGLALVALASVGAVAADEGPMAEAGLDQDAEVNTTVYLDAGGSLDPDGEVRRHEWSIETPNGSTVVPNCTTCVQTWFVPRQLGRYNVTVEVTDDDGRTREDTLFVFVGVGSPAGSDTSSDSSSGSPDPSGGGGGGYSPSSVGAPGGGGSSSGDTNALVTEEDGELVLVTGIVERGDTVRLPVEDGADVTVTGEEFMEEQEAPGRAPASAFRSSFREADTTFDDARESLQDNGYQEENRVAGSVESSTYSQQMNDLTDGLPANDDDDDGSTDATGNENQAIEGDDGCSDCNENSLGGSGGVFRPSSPADTSSATSTATSTVTTISPSPITSIASSAMGVAVSAAEEPDDDPIGLPFGILSANSMQK